MLGFIIELILWVPLSFVPAGLCWFFGMVVFGVQIESFLPLWKTVYISCVLVRIVVCISIPFFRYIRNVEREWDSNLRYLKWAKEHAKDPSDW